jgi:site-specific DNA-methyltransferase (adenine-specific)
MKQEIHQKDFQDLLADMPDNSVDLIFTDPAYWTLNKWRNVGTTTRLGGHRNADKQDETKWFQTIDDAELFTLLCESYRVLKKDRHAFIMCDGQTLKNVLGYVEEAGFNYYKPLVWDKVNQGMGYHFRCRHEFIVMLDKGKNRKPKNLSLPDIITIPMIRGGYPTEKPVELPELFVEQFTNKGETVIDPFCGSGSTLVAARRRGCQFIGGDISEDAVKLSWENVLKIPLNYADTNTPSMLPPITESPQQALFIH